MFKGETHLGRSCQVWATSLTDNVPEIFQDQDKMRSEHYLENLELRVPELKGPKRRSYFFVHTTSSSGPTQSLPRVRRWMGTWRFSRKTQEHEPMRGIIRTVAYRCVMNPKPAPMSGTNEAVSSIVGHERG